MRKIAKKNKSRMTTLRHGMTAALLAASLMSNSALAFGGMFSHGSKSTTYKGGVDAIGVHFGGNTADTPPSCPEHSTWSNETLKCECDAWYVMNEERHQCEETCAANRQCGDTCCGAGNICVDGNKCCNQNNPEDECCDIAGSQGFADAAGECCISGCVLLHMDGGDTLCVSAPSDSSCEDDYILLEYKHAYYCCPEGSTGVNDNGECI